MKHITKTDFRCPDCGKPLPPELLEEIKEAGVFEFRSIVGSTVTPKKKLASQNNIAAVNAAYSKEKRQEAAAKRKKKPE